MSEFAVLDDLNVRGRRVLVRCDLNLPMQDGKPSDLTRLERASETLRELAAKGARVIVLSHFGRPKGVDLTQSLAVLVAPLATALGQPVSFGADCIGPSAQATVDALKDGDVCLLENLRFHAGEEANNPTFTKALATLGEIWVNDAFSTAHRAHASTTGLGAFLPTAAGRLMEAELRARDKALGNPVRPVVAVVGGSKVSTKLDLLGNLVKRVDRLIVGGGMANTFLLARGHAIGKSLAEHDLVDVARAIEAQAQASGCQILLPEDAVTAERFAPNPPTLTVPVSAIPADAMMLDVGPAAVAQFIAALSDAKTLVWNGPLGAFETPPFDAGTMALARAAADLTKAGRLLSVAGGGDTVAALAKAGVVDDFSYVSTAGGAFLEWLEGKSLPGVVALRRG
jgi:phosphoglycerate kinase